MMPRRRRDELRRVQHSVWYDVDQWLGADAEGDGALPFPRYYLHSESNMFIEDVGLRIMPVSLNRAERQYRIWLEPDNADFERVVVEGISDRHYCRDLSDGVCEFVQNYAKSVLCFGEAIYEIAFLIDPDTEEVVAFDLVFLRPEQLVRQGDDWFEWIPGPVAVERGQQERIFLPSDSLVHFRAPAYIRSVLPSALDCLISASERLMPGFISRAMLNEDADIPFDVAMFEDQRARAVAAATKLVGWDGRGAVRERASEYYLLHRHLTFQRFTIKLRDGILAGLNEVVNRVAKRLGVTGRLLTAGLPTLADVDGAVRELRDGPSSLNALFRRFL